MLWHMAYPHFRSWVWPENSFRFVGPVSNLKRKATRLQQKNKVYIHLLSISQQFPTGEFWRQVQHLRKVDGGLFSDAPKWPAETSTAPVLPSRWWRGDEKTTWQYWNPSLLCYGNACSWLFHMNKRRDAFAETLSFLAYIFWSIWDHTTCFYICPDIGVSAGRFGATPWESMRPSRNFRRRHQGEMFVVTKGFLERDWKAFILSRMCSQYIWLNICMP